MVELRAVQIESKQCSTYQYRLRQILREIESKREIRRKRVIESVRKGY